MRFRGERLDFLSLYLALREHIVVGKGNGWADYLGFEWPEGLE